jgi:glc operon protein GlcG
MKTKITIDLHDASQLLSLGLKSASGLDAAVSICVVDDAGVMLSFLRMDGARSHTVELSIKKARAAALSGVSTKMIDQAIKAGLVTSVESVGWGGIPVLVEGQCAGAIGISGASPDSDDSIANSATSGYATAGEDGAAKQS